MGELAGRRRQPERVEALAAGISGVDLTRRTDPEAEHADHLAVSPAQGEAGAAVHVHGLERGIRMRRQPVPEHSDHAGATALLCTGVVTGVDEESNLGIQHARQRKVVPLVEGDEEASGEVVMTHGGSPQRA